MEKLAVNVKEAAQMLGVGMNRMYELVHTEGFPAVRTGTRYIIPLDGLRRWLNRTGEGANV